MKIGSRIKPRNRKSRTVTVHGREYVFLPVEDKLGQTHYVADVQDEAHATLLLGTLDFYAYDKSLAPVAAIKPPARVDTNAPTPPPVPALVAFPQDVMSAAEVLLNGSASAIGADVGKVKSLAVVKAAVAIEQTREKPRKSVITLLEQTLVGAAAAGVTDKP
jgi:hypothetical protein